MARQSFYAVYVLFKSEAEATAWEARLPERPPVPAEGEGDAIPPDPLWECHDVASIRDDRGGYYEGVFRKITGRDGDAIAAIARGIAERCYEPRKDGFVWTELAALAKGKLEAFGTYVAPVEESAEGVSLLGGGGAGGEM
ncbi:hypothetical protein [Azospirillum halopraeferens]|uniref:hypothetical protein n=1 Tax=Azospirillum halopraeferens TaxID=34010 RepID=UPI0004271146|nr:hypothetical protein [Azospirillum halopraeferens]